MECNRSRRRFLLGALGFGPAGGVQACRDGAPPLASDSASDATTGDLPHSNRDSVKPIVPAYRISLTEFGGYPGANAASLKSAFTAAFDALRNNGGGTLLVPAGLYEFGRYDHSVFIVSGNDLSNIVISAYGAIFKATTTANVMPHMFHFFNPCNITVAGASFIDTGFTPSVNWRGMYCVGIQADRFSSGFTMVDCFAEKVIGLFAANNSAATRRFLSDISIQGEVRNAYYGVGASFIRERVKIQLKCHNVRRAFIANALKDGEIRITATSTPDCLGSNGFIALVSYGATSGNVENVRISVEASGSGNYGSYVHFYHQGPEVNGGMYNIDATVNVSAVKGNPNLFTFDHESNGIHANTRRVWDKIYLHGKIGRNFSGSIISNPSISALRGRIYVDANLAAIADLSRLPDSFLCKS